jgi:hypothetical protein
MLKNVAIAAKQRMARSHRWLSSDRLPILDSVLIIIAVALAGWFVIFSIIIAALTSLTTG